MNWKSIISIIALLFIGFVAGFFTNRYLTVKTAHKIAELRKAKGMENRLYEVLALDTKQKEQLAPIIQSHFEELTQLNKMHQEKRITVIKGLKEAINPSLTDVQKKRFDRFSKKLKRFQRKRKKMQNGKKGEDK